MAFVDNRQFIEALDKTGDIVHIKQEVDWELEAGAIVRRTCEVGGPAVLFENIKDYPQDRRILGAPVSTLRRVAIAMGFAPETPVRELIREYEHRIQHPVKPKVVSDGPCKENVIRGDDVDLFRFPAPLIHDGDGGRYIGSWHIIITKDPESDWTNWGVYRTMVHNRNHLAVLLMATQHQGRVFYGKYAPKSQPMPFALAIGADPVCTIVAATMFRAGESEVDYAGALHQAPVELVKCETSDVLVPAHAEIVLEGEIIPDEMVPEGPFGEYTGYRHAERRLVPQYRVKAITHRNNPILTMSNVGMPIGEDHSLAAVTYSVMLKNHFLRQGIPINDVYFPPEFAYHLAIVGVKGRQPDVARRIQEGMTRALAHAKVIVVDEDVDVFNVNEALHAFLTKCHPMNGILASEHELVHPLMVFLTPRDREQKKGSLVVFDCTWPLDWDSDTYVPQRVYFKEMYPREIQERVLEEWHNYGFK